VKLRNASGTTIISGRFNPYGVGYRGRFSQKPFLRRLAIMAWSACAFHAPRHAAISIQPA
jgi:hypothetical protein